MLATTSGNSVCHWSERDLDKNKFCVRVCVCVCVCVCVKLRVYFNIRGHSF